jgi:hypothetical protein
LSSITLSSHLGSIDVGVFQDCTALHSITIPQSVVAISRNAFKQSGLVSITFEGSIDDIGGAAFSGCKSLRSIVLPTTAHIEDLAFYGCSNLETVVITGRVYEIRSYAFGECTALQTVTLLQSIPPLDGGNVFANCNDTVRLIVPCGAKEAYENSDWVNEPVVIEEDCGFAGAEWYYEILNENGSITYQHLEYVADTTINHKDVQIIIRTNTLYDKSEHVEVTREYVYEEDGVVYWWNKGMQEFTVLYNYAAEEGDEWEIKVGSERITLHVDAVEEYEYESSLFRMLRVSDAGDVFSGIIVCGIGHLTSFFPERMMSRGKNYRVEGMRCYWRNGMLWFKYGEEDCDAVYKDYHFGLDEPEESVFAVYPNPTHGVLTIHHSTFIIPHSSFRITNPMGQTLMTGTISEETQQIDVNNLPQGMYFITVGNTTCKFVVK